MTEFKLHNRSTTPEQTREALYQVEKKFGLAVPRSTRKIINEPCHRLLLKAEGARCTPAAGFATHRASHGAATGLEYPVQCASAQLAAQEVLTAIEVT